MSVLSLWIMDCRLSHTGRELLCQAHDRDDGALLAGRLAGSGGAPRLPLLHPVHALRLGMERCELATKFYGGFT